MKCEHRYRLLLVGASLLGLVLMTACSHDDGDKPLELVNLQFNFSLPLKKAETRMTGDVVQASGTEDGFRKMTDVHLLCFSSEPSKTSVKIGNMISLNTSGEGVHDDVTTQDFSMCQEISIPVGTKYFGFYARSGETMPTTHADKMKYGILETVGLSNTTYESNDDIRFRPVQVCPSTVSLGGSEKGQQLLDLLNELMSITGPEDEPNDKWATSNNIYLNEAYQRMIQLSTLSSFQVQRMLGAVNKVVNQVNAGDDGKLLADAILEKIADCCVTPPDATTDVIELQDSYMGFPDDLHLPAGAARIEWDVTQGKFVVLDAQNYGSGLSVSSVNDYVYPMNLQYQVLSDIVASDNLVIQNGNGDVNQYNDWATLLAQGYAGASKEVQNSTHSVAMVKQVEYAVGRMALRTRLDDTDGNIKDADGADVYVSNGFTLKGYIIGGQREVDYNFQPVAGSPRYAIYDTDLNGGVQNFKFGFTTMDYVLGLATEPNESIRMAIELVNDGQDFMGADGVIAKGATFYVVATLDPSDGIGYSTSMNRIFDRDHVTQVNLSITSFANATYGLPNLDIPHNSFGVSVNLSWESGLRFDDIEL